MFSEHSNDEEMCVSFHEPFSKSFQFYRVGFWARKIPPLVYVINYLNIILVNRACNAWLCNVVNNSESLMYIPPAMDIFTY